MKYIILALVTIFNSSCATQNVKNKTGISVEDLIKQGKDVYIEGKKFEHEIDFTSYLSSVLISEGVYQCNIKSCITFKNCVFDKNVKSFKTQGDNKVTVTSFFGNLSFIDCVFNSEVNFRGSTVHGRVDFTKSTFKSTANFEECSFTQNTFFNWSKFEGEHRFQNSFFQQKANFMNTEYYQNASFQNCTFNAEFQISASKFYKYADFSLIDCRANTLFNYSEFKKKADFSNAYFAQNLDFVNTQNNQTTFNNSRFMGNTNFSKLMVSESVSFKSCFFLFNKPQIDIPKEKVYFD